MITLTLLPLPRPGPCLSPSEAGFPMALFGVPRSPLPWSTFAESLLSYFHQIQHICFLLNFQRDIICTSYMAIKPYQDRIFFFFHIFFLFLLTWTQLLSQIHYYHVTLIILQHMIYKRILLNSPPLIRDYVSQLYVTIFTHSSPLKSERIHAGHSFFPPVLLAILTQDQLALM